MCSVRIMKISSEAQKSVDISLNQFKEGKIKILNNAEELFVFSKN